MTQAAVKKKYTKKIEGTLMLRHHADESFKSICVFFDSEHRRCTVYEARPQIGRAHV